MGRLALALLLVATGCSTGARVRAGDGFDPEALGACPHRGEIDYGEAGAFLSEPGAWARVTSVDLGSADDGVYRGTFEVLGGDRAVVDRLPPEVAALDIHHSEAAAIHTALAAGATVAVHIRYEPQGEMHSAFALALKDGEFAFLGDCQYRILTREMETRLGADAAARLAAVVGRPSEDVHALVRQRDPRLPLTTHRLADASKGTLAPLEKGWFSIEAPADWVGPYVVCTGVELGWSDCVDLATRASARRRVVMYYDPAATVHVGLFTAPPDLAEPVSFVLNARMADLLKRHGLDPATDEVELRASWEHPLPFDAVLDGRAEAQMGVTWRLVRG